MAEGQARLIDSHVHIWDPTVLEYSWLSGDLDRPYLPAEYRTGAPAVTGVIFVEAGPETKTGEVAWAESLGWPELLGVVALGALSEHGCIQSLHPSRERCRVQRRRYGNEAHGGKGQPNQIATP